MKNLRAKIIVLFAVLILMASENSFANTPPTIQGPHGHAQEVTGKIKLIRAQIQGLEIGDKEDFMDAEILVVLDNQPGLVFGFRYHNDNLERSSLETLLREAYFHNVPVTIAYKMEPLKKHKSIIWVQLGSYDK